MSDFVVYHLDDDRQQEEKYDVLDSNVNIDYSSAQGQGAAFTEVTMFFKSHSQADYEQDAVEKEGARCLHF